MVRLGCFGYPGCHSLSRTSCSTTSLLRDLLPLILSFLCSCLSILYVLVYLFLITLKSFRPIWTSYYLVAKWNARCDSELLLLLSGPLLLGFAVEPHIFAPSVLVFGLQSSHSIHHSYNVPRCLASQLVGRLVAWVVRVTFDPAKIGCGACCFASL